MSIDNVSSQLISLEEFCDLCESLELNTEDHGTFSTCKISDHPKYGNAILIQNAGDSSCLLIKI